MLYNKFKILALALVALTVAFTASCINDLNTSPIDDSVVTSTNVYDTPDDFRQVLAKVYAGYALTGQEGPAGNPDINVPDEGFSSYLRQFWVHQTITTDEAVVGWNDDGLPEYNYHGWTPSNNFLGMMYDRIFYQIVLTNEFIRQSVVREEQVIQGFAAEARFLRALSYWHAMDLFGGNIPFVSEDDPVGAYMPEPTTSSDLFNYIESELLDISSNLPAPGSNEYGRADQGAVWALLSKLYMNAEVYIGQDRYNDALTYINKIINEGGYALTDNYDHLFLADNDRSAVTSEIIFPIRFDGTNSRTYGGTTFIIHAGTGGAMDLDEIGINDGWGGHRTTPQFVEKFNYSSFEGFVNDNSGGNPEIYVPGGYQESSGYGNDWSPDDANVPVLISENGDDVYSGYIYFVEAGSEFKFTPSPSWNDGDFGGENGTLIQGGPNFVAPNSGLYYIRVDLDELTYEVNPADERSNFFTEGQSLEIESLGSFDNGYALQKWKNVTSAGQIGSNRDFVDTDFPMFRLADFYLMYAEATLRGASGDINRAVILVNELRERSFGSDVANISVNDLNLEFILDERARELYWEGHRRTDLRRFSQFTGDNYIWSWKGDDVDGEATESHYEIFPIPSSDINSNLNLTQNPGY